MMDSEMFEENVLCLLLHSELTLLFGGGSAPMLDVHTLSLSVYPSIPHLSKNIQCTLFRGKRHNVYEC